MPILLHKFRNHQVNHNTQILVLGTFNPDIPTGPTFFYGRPKNYLWQLLPGCWSLPSLKGIHLQEKQAFMAQYNIDFADIIASVEVPAGQETNVLDTYIDDKVNAWNDIPSLIDDCPNINAVYFTRKTFANIPNIYNKIAVIQDHCRQKGIRCCFLETPARFANAAKQQQWIETIIHQTTCLNR